MTFYEELNVASDADTDTIRKAYRALAKTCHPDVCKDAGAEERFKRLGQMVDVLTNPQDRAFYDASIDVGRRAAVPFGDSLFGVCTITTMWTEQGPVTSYHFD